MSNQNPVPQTAVGRVLVVTRGRSLSVGAKQTPTDEEQIQVWLREQVDKVGEALGKLAPPREALESELEGVRGARATVQRIVEKSTLDKGDVGAAQAGLELLIKEIAAAEEVVRKRHEAAVLELREAVKRHVAEPLLTQAQGEEKRPLELALQAIEEKLTAPTNLGLEQARPLVAGLPALVGSARQAITERHEREALRIREAVKRLLADERLREAIELESAPVNAVAPAVEEQFKTLSNDSLAAAQKLLDGLPALIDTCKKAITQRLTARAKLVLDAVGPKTELGKPLDGALANDEKELARLLKSINDGLGVPLLTAEIVETAEREKEALAQRHAKAKQAVGDLGGPASSKKLKLAFPDGDQLDAFVAESLGGQHKLLGKLLTDGCGGDANKLKTFGEAFAGAGDRKRMGQLLKAGGLADKPAAMMSLLNVGCGGDPAEFRKLTQRFTADDPGVETAQLKNLKALIGTGGLGDQPEVLGHLLKTGCPGKPDDGEWDFERFCAEFGKNPADLDKLLNQGGFAEKKTPPPVLAETLARMLSIGCDGDPSKLAALANSAGIAKFKGLLETGGLGEQPQALGHAFKLGCDGDPVKLVALHDAFDGSGGAKLGRLKSMLKDGNLAQRPEMLGVILGTGCGKQPDKLKDMGVAFTGHMGELKEMVDTWGDKSGESIKALTGPRHLDGDFKKLQTQFTRQLGLQIPDPVKRKRLIEEAPKFTRTLVVTPKALNDGLTTPLKMDDPGLSDFDATDCDYLLAHICERHLQTHFAFKGAQAAPTPIDHKNTQFPDDWSPQDMADLMKAALLSVDGQAKLAEIKLEIDTWAQAKQVYKLKAKFLQDYPSQAAWERHRDAHRDWLRYDKWANEASPVNPRRTKQEMYSAYQNRSGPWRGGVPEGPPCAWPNHPWKRSAPPPIPPGLNNNPDPGPAPSPQRDFTHGSYEFRVGVKREQGRMKITQLFPLKATPANLLKQFKKAEMEALRDAMVP